MVSLLQAPRLALPDPRADEFLCAAGRQRASLADQHNIQEPFYRL